MKMLEVKAKNDEKLGVVQFNQDGTTHTLFEIKEISIAFKPTIDKKNGTIKNVRCGGGLIYHSPEEKWLEIVSNFKNGGSLPQMDLVIEKIVCPDFMPNIGLDKICANTGHLFEHTIDTENDNQLLFVFHTSSSIASELQDYINKNGKPLGHDR